MDKIKHYYKLCGINKKVLPPINYINEKAKKIIVTQRHIDLFLNESNGAYYIKNMVTGGKQRERYKIVVIE